MLHQFNPQSELHSRKINEPKPMPVSGLRNAQIADQVLNVAQLLTAERAKRLKINGDWRAAHTIRILPQRVDLAVRTGKDPTQYPAIGNSISSAIREIVLAESLVALYRLSPTSGPGAKE